MAAAAATAAWLTGRRSPGRFRILRYPVFAVSALYLFWAFSSQQTRFLYPLLFLAALGAGFLMPLLTMKQRRLCLIAIGAAAAFSIFPPGFNHYRQAWKLHTLSTREPVKFLSFAARDPEYFTMLEYIGKHIPADSRLLLVFERRGLYVPREYRIGTPCFQQAHFTPVPADAAGTLSAIRHSGADYLLIGASSQDPDYLEAYNEENARLAGHLRTLLRDGALTLVEVPGTGAYTLLKVN